MVTDPERSFSGAEGRSETALCTRGDPARPRTLKSLSTSGQPFVARSRPQEDGVTASPFLDDTRVYYGNRTKTIRKTKCHPETPHRLLPHFPWR